MFDPDSPSSRLNAKSWVNLVERARNGVGNDATGAPKISNKELASKAIMMLRGTAALWSDNLVEEDLDPNPLDDWRLFKTAFLARFYAKATLSERTALMRSLSQKPSETVIQFLDRVKQAHYIFYENWPSLQDSATNAEKAADKAAKKKSLEMHISQSFINGLYDDIREHVLMQESNNLATLLTIAQRIEASKKTKPKLQVASTSVLPNPDDFECPAHKASVDAVNRYNLSQRGNPGRGRGRGFRNRGQGQSNRPRFTGTCPYCQKIGHKLAQCFTKRNDERRKAENVQPQAAKSYQAATVEANDDQNREVNTITAEETLMATLNQYTV